MGIGAAVGAFLPDRCDHLYLDGALVSMTGLETRITAPPGVHTLEAEFVAVDHAPFQPRVRASVTFRTGP